MKNGEFGGINKVHRNICMVFAVLRTLIFPQRWLEYKVCHLCNVLVIAGVIPNTNIFFTF